MESLRHESVIFIRATPDEIWRAITDPEMTRRYYYGTDIKSEWTPGARWTSESGDELSLDGDIIEIEAPHLLVQSFHVATEDDDAFNEPASTVTWEITPMGDASRVRIVHEGMGQATREYVEDGWELILSGMKTLLETGEALKIGAPSTL
jgi:uncharacterized protein YndB with AHSA1/START domain